MATLQGFKASRLQGFKASRLHCSREFRAFALIAVTSLSLAACGSGGGESTDPTRKSRLDQREKELEVREQTVSRKEKEQKNKDEQQTVKERELNNKEKELNNRPPRVVTRMVTVPRPAPPRPVGVPFAELNDAEKTLAYAAIQKTYFGMDISPIDLQGRDSDDTTTRNGRIDNMALQITAWEDRHFTHEGEGGTTSSAGDLTKVVVVTPKGSTGNIDYTFDLWNTGTLTGNSIYNINYGDYADYDVSLTTALAKRGDEYKIFSIGENDYTTTNMTESIGSKFEDSYQYNFFKDYQVLKAKVDTDKDNQKDSTLYAELWTDYSGSNADDYFVGGVWLLMPDDMSQAARFGGFVRGDDPIFLTRTVAPYTGTATYKGSLAGLHTSSKNDMPKISRLLGKVTLDVDFGDATKYGTIAGRGYDLKLDGTPVTGEILININGDRVDKTGATGYSPKTKREDPNVGNINGVNYKGAASVMFHTLNDDETNPAALVGTVGGRGGGNSFVATFGAREAE